METTTCQICGRIIKSGSGLIAHHGYTRPGNGWQTASCMGTGFRPYEIACDALPVAIAKCEAFIEQRKAWLADWLAHPPSSIESARNLFGGGTGGSRAIYTRPESFKPDGTGSSIPRTYANEYANWARQAEAAISSSSHTLAYLKKRLADWREPALSPRKPT